MAANRSVLAILALMGCSAPPEPTAPPTGLNFAYAGPGCAPWDGYAVSLVLRGEPLAPGDSVLEGGDSPQLRLAIYPRGSGGTKPSGLRPGTYRWPDKRGVAAGALCERGRYTAIPSGRITVREIGADGRLTGYVDLRLAAGRTTRGGFGAEWRPRRMFCG